MSIASDSILLSEDIFIIHSFIKHQIFKSKKGSSVE